MIGCICSGCILSFYTWNCCTLLLLWGPRNGFWTKAKNISVVLFQSSTWVSRGMVSDWTKLTLGTVKGVEELVANFDDSTPAAGYLGVIIALCFWATVWWLESIGGTRLLRPYWRKLLSDYAFPVSRCLPLKDVFKTDNLKIATIFWTGFSHIPGRIKSTDPLRIPLSLSLIFRNDGVVGPSISWYVVWDEWFLWQPGYNYHLIRYSRITVIRDSFQTALAALFPRRNSPPRLQLHGISRRIMRHGLTTELAPMVILLLPMECWLSSPRRHTLACI